MVTIGQLLNVHKKIKKQRSRVFRNHGLSCLASALLCGATEVEFVCALLCGMMYCHVLYGTILCICVGPSKTICYSIASAN